MGDGLDQLMVEIGRVRNLALRQNAVERTPRTDLHLGQQLRIGILQVSLRDARPQFGIDLGQDLMVRRVSSVKVVCGGGVRKSSTLDCGGSL